MLSEPNRKSANLTLDATLLREAKALNVNLSRAAEAGIQREVERTRAERWTAENRAALDSSNDFADAQDLPLGHLRLF